MNIINILFFWFCVQSPGVREGILAIRPKFLDYFNFFPVILVPCGERHSSRKVHSQCHTALHKSTRDEKSLAHHMISFPFMATLPLIYFFFQYSNYSRNSCFHPNPNKHSWLLPLHIHTFLRIWGLIYFHHISLRTLYVRNHPMTVHQFFIQHSLINIFSMPNIMLSLW